MTTTRTWPTRPLGNTGLHPTIMGIGCAWLGHDSAGSFDERTGADTVLRGLESGMNFIDTSGAYIGGRSEQFIGVALREWFARGNRREDLIICTKTGTRVRPPEYSYDFTMKSVETSLAALGIDYLDILLIHDPVTLDPVFAPGGALEALERLKEEKVIGAIGLGCRKHEHHRRCIESGDFEVSLTFKDYNLIDRTALAGVIEPANAKGVGVINASIMVNGYLGGAEPRVIGDRARMHGRLDEELIARAQIKWEWCRDRGIDLGLLNLHYCLRDPRIASTVIGFSTPQRIDQNVEAFFNPVDESVWEELFRDFPELRS
jgi:D-threo-aldose 1-dehydrogenase